MTRAVVGRGAVLVCVAGGFAVAIWSVGAAGLEPMIRIARRLGFEGFGWYCCYSLGVFGIMGAAWLAAAGAPVERIALFAWARLVREATADFLPFSQVGGLVVGARVLTTRGIPHAIVHASMIVDLATEIASQLVFTIAGLVALAMVVAEPERLRPLVVPVALGGGVLVAILAALAAAPAAWRLVGRFEKRFGARAAIDAEGVAAALRALQRRRARVAATFGLNLLAWIASAAGAWVVLRLMGVAVPLVAAVALESLVFLLRSVAFAIPGGIGVQELGYLVAGPIVGLPPEAALALAMAKRARDLALGVPTLVLWQAAEARAFIAVRLARARKPHPDGGAASNLGGSEPCSSRPGGRLVGPDG